MLRETPKEKTKSKNQGLLHKKTNSRLDCSNKIKFS